MPTRTAVAFLSCLVTALLALPVYAVNPNPLEDAYWRMEEGPEGAGVAASNPDHTSEGARVGTVLDWKANGNSMRRWTDANAPIYTSEVPAPVVPATGQANTLALRFNGAWQDIYTDRRDINNPRVTAFTLEASFNADSVAAGPWQTIVSKESRREANNPGDCNDPDNDCLSDAPPLALKIRGDDGRLMIQVRDLENNLVDVHSLGAVQAGTWYHAAVVATSSEISLWLNSNDGQGYVFQGSATVVRGPLWQGTDEAVNDDGGGYDTVWNIGKGMWARVLTDYFGGVIDEVRLSNTALDVEDFLWYASPLLGDFDTDGDVDALDFGVFMGCATGPEVPADPNKPGCGGKDADLDDDNDVDMDDFGIFQANYTGAL